MQDVLVGEIQAPYDFDLVGEALLHAADDRRGVGQLEALRTFDGDYRSRDLVGRDVRIMEPSVLSVASMCRAVIFGSFSMRRVRFFPGHVPAVLTSVDAGRACGPIGASANQDGVGMGVVDRRRVPKTSPIHDAIPTPVSQPRTMAEGALARFLPATTEDVVCARVLCLG